MQRDSSLVRYVKSGGLDEPSPTAWETRTPSPTRSRGTVTERAASPLPVAVRSEAPVR